MVNLSLNKWVKATVVALAMAVPALSHAAPDHRNCNVNDDGCNTCIPCNPCDWGFTFGIDALYWKPCIDDLDYAASFTDLFTIVPTQYSADFEYHTLCNDWTPGVRLYLMKPEVWCDLALNVSWTYLHVTDTATSSVAQDTATATPDTLVSTLLHPFLAIFIGTQFDYARARYDMTYHDWDLLLTYRYDCNPCHALFVNFGVAGLVLDQGFHVRYDQNNILTVPSLLVARWSHDSNYWGVGLRVGVDYEYAMSRCMTLYAMSEGTVVAGSVHANEKHVLDPNVTAVPGLGALYTLRFKDSSHCHCMPGMHLAAGFRMDERFCDCDFYIRLGYEFTAWHNVPNHRIHFGDLTIEEAAHGTSASVRTLVLHGVTLGVGMEF